MEEEVEEAPEVEEEVEEPEVEEEPKVKEPKEKKLDPFLSESISIEPCTFILEHVRPQEPKKPFRFAFIEGEPYEELFIRSLKGFDVEIIKNGGKKARDVIIRKKGEIQCELHFMLRDRSYHAPKQYIKIYFLNPKDDTIKQTVIDFFERMENGTLKEKNSVAPSLSEIMDDSSHSMDDSSHSMDDSSHSMDDSSHSMDDLSHSMDDSSHSMDKSSLNMNNPSPITDESMPSEITNEQSLIINKLTPSEITNELSHMTPNETLFTNNELEPSLPDFSLNTSPVNQPSDLQDTSIRSADGFYKPVNYTPVYVTSPRKWRTKKHHKGRHYKKRRYTKKHHKGRQYKKRRYTKKHHKKHPKKQHKHKKPYTKKQRKH